MAGLRVPKPVLAAIAIAQINITPLVDVMLVLLVIFMVTAPALTATLDLRLPQPPPTDRTAAATDVARPQLRRIRTGRAADGGGQLEAALRAVAQGAPTRCWRSTPPPMRTTRASPGPWVRRAPAGIENIALPALNDSGDRDRALPRRRGSPGSRARSSSRPAYRASPIRAWPIETSSTSGTARQEGAEVGLAEVVAGIDAEPGRLRAAGDARQSARASAPAPPAATASA